MEIRKTLKLTGKRRFSSLATIAVIKHFLISWAPAGGRGEASPPPETEKIVLEKCCYFPELYKMRKVREDGIENG